MQRPLARHASLWDYWGVNIQLLVSCVNSLGCSHHKSGRASSHLSFPVLQDLFLRYEANRGIHSASPTRCSSLKCAFELCDKGKTMLGNLIWWSSNGTNFNHAGAENFWMVIHFGVGLLRILIGGCTGDGSDATYLIWAIILPPHGTGLPCWSRLNVASTACLSYTCQ